ncbi:GNAT family N-acetyltransferase [Salidesulfovibrio onnuriiensis]|uniref:GNAT family N-acetyltransferase n=1 Tax=Salidesulfovibrio onnuriiensis TaxID=2583823 RepID=UPI001C9C2B83|nr:GNAT family N-acetyltransferase [Salidesulfovibrio onnuriiensis]
MEIVAAAKQDHAEITDVWEASVRATHHFLSEEDILFFRPLVLNEYLAAVDLYCLKDGNGKIHGFLGVLDGKIEMLFLDPESRGKGLGRLLLTFAVETLGADKVDVNEQNPAAVGFYEHMGFRVAGRSALDGSGKPFPLLHMER